MSTPQKKKKTPKAKDMPENIAEEPPVNTVLEETVTLTESVTETTPMIEPGIVKPEILKSETVKSEILEPETLELEKEPLLDEVSILTEIKEEIKEKINEVIAIQIPKNLVDLVKEEIKQKTHILNKEYIDILNSLVSISPNLLNDIEKAMFEIMKDGKIDSNDIPYLITIIQKLYEFMFSLKIEKMSTEKRSAICAEVIKFIVHVLIKERRIKVDPSKQDAFLSQFNALMDSCVSLLSLQSELLSKGCCSCFFSKK
jgi:hypothetical protein